MAAITLKTLRQKLYEAYEMGYHGSLDLKESLIEELIVALLNTPDTAPSCNDGWRIYKVKELRSFPVGTIFEHVSRGKGWIYTIAGERCMKFASGDVHFYDDVEPWNEVMRIVGNIVEPRPKITFPDL